MRIYHAPATPDVVAHWLKAALRAGYRDPAFEGANAHTPSGDGYEAVAIADHVPSGSRLIYSRDTGHHTSGWFRNPDYERCLHLSISYRHPILGITLPHDWPQTRRWIDLIFADWRRYIWTESPKSREGELREVWHFRVFCDERWQAILPRGEVYASEFTEKGWRSFSEVRELREREARR